jgi:hypothetical protein
MGDDRPDDRPFSGDPKGSASLGAILGGNAWSMLICAGATLAMELGAYGLARGCGAGAREALLAALAGAVMWVALAGGPMAAGGKGNASAALRGAIPADASLVALLILWPLARADDSQTYLTLASVAKAYCVLAGMALFSIAAVCCPTSTTGRRLAGLGAAMILATAIATPFLTSGIIHALDYRRATSVVAWAIHANPFYSVTAAATERLQFFWHRWGLMYDRIGAFRDYPPPPVQWYSSAILYGAMAGVLGLVAVLRRIRFGSGRW